MTWVSSPRNQERLAYLRATWGIQTAGEQATALGISYSLVTHLRSYLRQEGSVDLSRRGRLRQWTEDEVARAEMMIADGCSIDRVAQRLHRSPNAVTHALRAYGLGGIDQVRDLPHAMVRSQRQICDLFAVSPWWVRIWIREGWLVARRNHIQNKRPKHRRCQFLITDEALYQFLEVQAAWPTYEPGQITDADWRQRAQDLRAAAGNPLWVTAQYAATQLHYSTATVLWQLRIGRLAGVKLGERWFVRWPQAAVPRIRVPAPTPDGWLSPRAYAAQMNYSVHTVRHQLRAGTLESIKVGRRRLVRWPQTRNREAIP